MWRFFAHSENPEGKKHELIDHLRAVAVTAKKFADPFGAPGLAYWAGLWHDLGKFHPDFQAYLNDPEARRGPDHSSAGMVFASSHWDGLCYLIAGHHAGLPSFANLKTRLAEKKADAPVQEALSAAVASFAEIVLSEKLDGLLPSFWALQSPNDGQGKRNRELFLRILFSALVDADFLDTESHFHREKAVERGISPSLDELWQRFEKDQEAFSGREPTKLQQARDEIYRACLKAADEPPGLFRLTVPTGGGKTRFGLGFALRHARRHGLERVVVAIPYTSITGQTARVYRNIFKDLGERAVLEHHSAAADRDGGDSPVMARQQWSRLAAENWDAPLIVTTTVQLFESLFAHKPSKCRKLHRLARSVVILDEVQTLPPEMLDPILDVLGQLVRHYGLSVMFCTATQPAFDGNRYLRGLAEVREIVPNAGRFFDDLKRVEYRLPGGEKWAWERVAEEMRSDARALAVVNTKKDALALLDALGEDSSALHLSTLLCGQHREDVIDEVRRRLEKGEPCRLVSTQVVEAGVDLDFPLVLRAVGPLDRIVQAAGRCNREDKLPGPGRVVVFDPADGGTPPGAYKSGLDEARVMLNNGCDLHDPATYEQYFSRLFQDVDTDKRKIQPLREARDFPKVAEQFKMIDDAVPVVVRYPGHEKEIDKLLAVLRKAEKPPRGAFRGVQRFVVAVFQHQLDQYEGRGLVRPVTPGLWEWCGGYDLVRGLKDLAYDPDRCVV
jgi:CRISPR-associated endonuclease/helicase Cas3